MPVITPVPLYMSNASLKVAADNYEAAVSSVTFTPSTSVATFKGLRPGDVYKHASNSEWVCELAFVQDWATAGSLSRYLYDHEGETVDVVFEPEAGGPSITASVVIVPGSIGGAVDAFATSTVQLGVNGKPELEAAA